MILQFLLVHLISYTVTLAWDQNPEPDIAGYRIYERIDGATDYEFRVEVAYPITTVSFSFEPYKHYEFVATAFNTSALESDYSNSVSFVKGSKLSISSYEDGPSKVVTLSADVYAGMPYEVEGTRDFQSWETVASGVSTLDRLDILFNPDEGEPHLFFRLKKSAPLFRLFESASTIPSLRFSEPTKWERVKHFFRYRPGRHPDLRKAAERSMAKEKVRENLKPPMPIPLRVR